MANSKSLLSTLKSSGPQCTGESKKKGPDKKGTRAASFPSLIYIGHNNMSQVQISENNRRVLHCCIRRSRGTFLDETY